MYKFFFIRLGIKIAFIKYATQFKSLPILKYEKKGKM